MVKEHQSGEYKERSQLIEAGKKRDRFRTRAMDSEERRGPEGHSRAAEEQPGEHKHQRGVDQMERQAEQVPTGHSIQNQ